jgi:hypothetical protein
MSLAPLNHETSFSGQFPVMFHGGGAFLNSKIRHVPDRGARIQVKTKSDKAAYKTQAELKAKARLRAGPTAVVLFPRQRIG